MPWRLAAKVSGQGAEDGVEDSGDSILSPCYTANCQRGTLQKQHKTFAALQSLLPF